ncbi:MAG: hypothetical protein WBD45_17155, partial [Terriglobales bacterium]
GYDRESDLTFPDIEDRVGRSSLCEDSLFLRKSADLPAHADRGKEALWVEIAPSFRQHGK